jgi:hypothetical protein
MPNPIKYTTVIQPNSINTGNFAIGVNKGGYGPSSVTKFYNGRTPNIGGYAIYTYELVEQQYETPVILINSDADLITLSIQLGGVGITTIGDALIFFNASTTMLCVNIDYPNIFANDLVLNLDADFTPSHPGTGSNWEDLSGYGNNGTLVNGAVYNSITIRNIAFDGVNDMVQTSYGGTLNDFTVITWFRSIGGTRNYNRVVDKNYETGMWIGRNSNVVSSWGGGVMETVAPFGRFITLADSAWHMIVSRREGNLHTILGDGITNKVSGIVSTAALSSDVFTFGNFIGTNPNASPLIGGIGQILIYDRALSDDEILQNYYAGIKRFVSTASLILSIDSENMDKRVSAPSIAYDRSGGQRNGDMMNGLGLSVYDRPTFVFDGLNDYINIPFTLSLSNVFTISTYINVNTSGGTYAFYSTNPTNIIRVSGDKVVLATSETNVGDFTLTGTTTIEANTWYYVSVVVNNTVASIYINGVLDATTTRTFPIVSWTTNESNIGRRNNSVNNFYFNGNITTVDIYNRALSVAELVINYDSSRTRYNK